ncbi:MAG: hypothetical protein M1812_001676 [Candelaria pacifica]|nr:MAG: hypothetical protein M1812_001676 [Candelaria pacifica]
MLFNPVNPSEMRLEKPSKFPLFQDGDVTISLSPSDEGKLVLHSTQLQQGSEFFKAGLNPRWSSNKIMSGITAGGTSLDPPKIRYELCLDEDGQDWFLIGKVSESSPEDRKTDIKRFNLLRRQRKAVNPSEAPRADCEGFRFLDAKNPFSEVVRDHRNLFALLYGRKLRLRSLTAAKDILANLVYLAEVYGCLPAVSKPIERCIIQSGLAGYKAIAKHPCFYLNLAAKIRSRSIFEEAIRHAVGKWKTLQKFGLTSVTADVAEKVQLRRNQLFVKVSLVRANISKLRNGSLQDDPDIWLATAIFRDWASTTIFHATPDSKWGAYCYKKLLSDQMPRGLEYYLKHSYDADEYSAKRFAPFLATANQETVDKSLEKLQIVARRIARPLLNGYKGEVPAKFTPPDNECCYFTHCRIFFKDLPWADKTPWDGWLDRDEVSSTDIDEASTVDREAESSDIDLFDGIDKRDMLAGTCEGLILSSMTPEILLRGGPRFVFNHWPGTFEPGIFAS